MYHIAQNHAGIICQGLLQIAHAFHPAMQSAFLLNSFSFCFAIGNGRLAAELLVVTKAETDGKNMQSYMYCVLCCFS